MKSLMLLWTEALTDVGAWCGVSTDRDRKTAAARFEHEGLSFFTITLPDFGKDFQKALDRGWVTHDDFTGFRFHRRLPQFLGGFLELVFDRDSGSLLNVPDIDAIFSIRQICLLLEKVEIDCTPKRKARTYVKYVECEQQVKEADSRRSHDDYRDFSRICQLLFANALTSADKLVAEGGIVPKHGPGATAEGTLGNAKYVQREWPQRLERVFPIRECLIPSERFAEDLDCVDLLEPGAERPVRVISVPKTLKAPRIIAIEPVAMQYAQQGLLRVLRFVLHANHLPGWKGINLCSQFINLDDQSLNQAMAQQGSITGDLATLDLSDASDRVSNQLVRELFKYHPHLFEGVDASRSRKADVPDHGVLRLAKFASMGSALTFPIETMVFLALVMLGIERELREPLTYREILALVGRVRIYGDDIVVPVEYAVSVIRCLEDFGLRVNRNKTFMNGKFRESCGGDFYDGVWITPVRLRKPLPSSRTDAEGIISTVEFRNNLYKAGLWRTAAYVDGLVEEVVSHYPSIHEGSPVLGRITFLDYQVDRMCPSLHRPLVKGYRIEAKPPVNEIDGHAALLKWFLLCGDEPLEREHLKRSGRPWRVALKPGWATPY